MGRCGLSLTPAASPADNARVKQLKPLWKISISTSLEAEDAVSELLAHHTGLAVSAYFNLETGISLVSAYAAKPLAAAARTQLAQGLKGLAAAGLKAGRPRIAVKKIKREDWAESWKRHFKPMLFGRQLLVKPSWSKKAPRAGQQVVILDPGLSFGTGQHATTSFCLHQIVAATTANKTGKTLSMVDVGTGSGILAIAADKLGFAPVHAFDFDPEAVRVAKVNAATNRIRKSVKIYRGDVTKLPVRAVRQYDFACANLIANLLIAERKKISGLVKPGGTLVLAGILAKEFSEVAGAFGKLGWKLTADRIEKEWHSGAFRRP